MDRRTPDFAFTDRMLNLIYTAMTNPTQFCQFMPADSLTQKRSPSD
jgi:hypothetical protein